eukprot:TRINITY_DN6185_c0_g1_i1.p1 TRINITY_DN6185_c0_g1~~TRINITY_DN6185_c0_g1_i1.p1  ORF type:complete len:1597 (+),score=250.53 TRINITY_DN6185_c0_g1_i1:108-4898(+)
MMEEPSPTLFEAVRTCTSSTNSRTTSTVEDAAEDFNPIFGRPPLIRLETLSSTHVRWVFFIFYFSLAVTMFFRIEQHRIFTCEILCPVNDEESCKLNVPAAWTPQEDTIHCTGRNISLPSEPLNDTVTASWSAELHDVTEFSRFLYLYMSVADNATIVDHDVVIVATYEAPLGIFTEIKKTIHWTCTPTCSEAKQIARFDYVHESESLTIEMTVASTNTTNTTLDEVANRLSVELVTGNTGFSKMELSVRCVCILACFIILIRLLVMLSLSGFELWFPEHLWLLYVVISVCFILCNPWWYWTLIHEDFSTGFEKFKYILHTIGYDFCGDLLKTFEFVACCSLRDAGTESYWLLDKMFWPAVIASCWLMLITLTRVLQLTVSRSDPWVYGLPLFNDFFTNPVTSIGVSTYEDVTRNTTFIDFDTVTDTGGHFNSFNNILFRTLQVLWYIAIIIQALRTSLRLRSIPYLQSRYRQLTFRFAVYLYLCYIVTWIPPYVYHMFTDSNSPPTTPYNIGEVIGSVAYSCILAYVCTPITDYQHKLVYDNEIPNPGDREWVNSTHYNPGFRRFLASSQSLFFFFTEDERDKFIAAQDKAVDTFLASRAQEHYSSSGIPHLFENLSLTDAKSALLKAKEQAMSGIKSGKDRVLRKAANLPTTVASMPEKAKEAAVKSATAVKKGVMHPVDTATNVTSRTVEIFEQTLEKIHPKSETVDRIKTGVHGALGLPVVLGKRENDNMTVTVSPPSPNDSVIEVEEARSVGSTPGSPDLGMASLSQSGSFRRPGRRKSLDPHHVHDKETVANWMLGWFERFSSDVSSIQTEPEPLFCLETCSKLFNLSWEVYFLDPASSDEVRQELQRAIDKRVKARWKRRKTNNDTPLKRFFRRLSSNPTIVVSPSSASPQSQEMRSLTSPSTDKRKQRSGRLSSLSALKRNTFINKKHLLRVRTRYEASDGPKERERLLLEALEDKLEINVSQYGYSLVRVVARKQNQAIICQKDEHLVIAFRGTDNTENLKTDLKLTRVDIENWLEPRLGLFKKSVNAFGLLRPKVHRGFLQVWREYLKAEIMDELRGITTRHHINHIYLTGHSLGGALACLAAWDIARWIHEEIGLDSQDRPAIQLTHYSFGCPRVGNPEFTKLFNQAVPDSFRIVNDGDPVCLTPPKVGYGVASLYSHPGKLVKVDWKGNFVIRPGYVEKSLPSWHLRSADPAKHQMAGTVVDFSAGKTVAYRSALDAVFSYCNIHIRCFDPLLTKIANDLQASAETARQVELLDFPIFSPFSDSKASGVSTVQFNKAVIGDTNQRKVSTDSSLRSGILKKNDVASQGSLLASSRNGSAAHLDRGSSLGSMDHLVPAPTVIGGGKQLLPSFIPLPQDRSNSASSLLYDCIDHSENTGTGPSDLSNTDNRFSRTIPVLIPTETVVAISGIAIVAASEIDRSPGVAWLQLGLVSDCISRNSSLISPLCVDSCLTTPQLASGGASTCSSGKSRSVDGRALGRQQEIQQMMLKYGYSPYTPLKPLDLHRATPPPLTPPRRGSALGPVIGRSGEYDSKRSSTATIATTLLSLPSQAAPYPSEIAMDYLYGGSDVRKTTNLLHSEYDDELL